MTAVNLQDPKPLENVKLLVIYLGNKCNFDCVYCDRGYIESVGGQSLGKQTADNIEKFFLWAEKQPNKIKRVSFHGGEPLLFIKRMKEIMVWLHPLCKRNGWIISMTTNGSLVADNVDFFEQYSGNLAATVSYDFIFQNKNRDVLDVEKMAAVLNKHCVEWKWQYVLPINDPQAFSFENLQDVVQTCYKTNCRVVNIIPLRHMRGKDKFDVLIDRVNLEQYFDALMQFIQILYVKKINVFIDGNYTEIDKNYFGDHSKLILAPDGYLYPEFDFLEYKLHEMRIGLWDTEHPQVWKQIGNKAKILDSCVGCPSEPSCGLKYLYKLFNETPKGACVNFYKYTDFIIRHNNQLKTKKHLLEWVGIDDTFEVKHG